MILVMFAACQNESNFLCAALDEKEVRKTIEKFRSEDWRNSSLAVKHATLIALEMITDPKGQPKGGGSSSAKPEVSSREEDVRSAGLGSEGKEGSAAEKPKLSLAGWAYEYASKKTSFSTNEYYKIAYTLKNGYSKAIKLIDATIQFNDLLGDNIYGIKVEKDLLISAGSLKQEEGLFSINQFISSQRRMKGMEKSDIRAVLHIQKLVLEDNTVLSFEE